MPKARETTKLWGLFNEFGYLREAQPTKWWAQDQAKYYDGHVQVRPVTVIYSVPRPPKRKKARARKA